MTSPASPSQDDAIAELLELGRSALREAHARLVTAEEDRFDGRMQAFNRAARSVRQTLALQQKFARDRQEAAKAARVQAEGEIAARAQRRRGQLRIELGREIWSEAEGQEAERLESDLDDLLDAEVLTDGFLAEPVWDQISRLRGDLGLPPLDVAPPPDAAPAEQPLPWRSSA